MNQTPLNIPPLTGRTDLHEERTLLHKLTAGRLFLRAGGIVRRRAPTMDAIWSGLWLGILPTSAIDAIDRTVYDKKQLYHSAEHNLQGLFPWESEAVRTYFSGCLRLMVLGAGGGREVIGLRRLGFEADGWEPNPNLVSVARALLRTTGCAGDVHIGPRSQIPEDAGSYDGMVFGWTMYMLVPGRTRRIALLRGARARLGIGAPLLLSFHTRPEKDHCRRSARVMRIARPIRRLLLRSPPEFGDDMRLFYIHRFTRADIEQELEAGGFRLAHYERLDHAPYGHGWAVGGAN